MSVYWRTVDGLTLQVPVSGHPALELCNTRTGWDLAEPREFLESYDHVVALAVDRELLAADDAERCRNLAAADRAEAGAVLGQVLRLREDLYRVMTRSGSAAAARRVDGAMLAARRRCRFAGLDEGGRPAWTTTPDLRAPLDAFARAVESLLRSPEGAAVAACPGPGCGWLFTDLTQRRRWCSMQWCGNRAKARRHSARTRSSVGS